MDRGAGNPATLRRPLVRPRLARTLKALGPGVLFTGAAVGVSHLVQATRAGAAGGLGLALVIVLAHVVKYPAFRFGPQYAAATGTSMLEGYRRRGRSALVLYGLLTLGTMFTVQAAVTFVTAALLLTLLGLAVSPVLVSALLLLLCYGVLRVGRFPWLDRLTKVAVASLTVATLVATALALPGALEHAAWPPATLFAGAGALSLAALVGWMPSAIDVSVWQSLWVLAKAEAEESLPTVRASLLDFHVGYATTAVLALAFLVLGASVFRGEGIELAASAPAFAAQLVDLYARQLGAFSRPLIAAAAFLTMFSTTLTVADGFPRALSVLALRLRAPEPPAGGRSSHAEVQTPRYWVFATVLGAGSVALLAFAVTSLGQLVDLATTLSFLTAPALAALNHRAMTGPEVPVGGRPGRALRALSLVGIGLQALFALAYLAIRFAP